MDDLGLSKADLRLYEKGLAKTHPIRVRVNLLDGDEKQIASLTADQDHVVAGQVDVDWTAEIVRQASLTIIDPKNRLELDPYAPRDRGLWLDRFIAIERGDWIDELDDFVFAPVFWGPLSHYEFEGSVLSLEGLGKEVLGLAPHVLWKSLNWPKGTPIAQVVRKLLREQGERRIEIPEGYDRKLQKRLSVGKMQEPWKRVQRLCRAGDRQGFYDGRGRFRMRREPERPSFTFQRRPEAGEPAFLVDDPTWSFDWESVRNVVEVLGRDPKGKDKRVRAVARAEPNHPLSAQSLARNGQPRYMVEQIEVDHASQDQVERIAERKLDRLLRMGLEFRGESMPVPHLEELDVIVVKAHGQRAEVPLKTWSLPLTANDGTMPIGFVRRRPAPRRPGKKGKRRR